MFMSLTIASTKGRDIDQEDRMVIERLVDRSNTAIIFLGMLSGHNGSQAAEYVEKELWPTIKKMVNFETANDQDVLDAMKTAFWKIHKDMREEVANWPNTIWGAPSMSGTTCSCTLIRNKRLYIAHSI
ncbi:Protein phosphatase, Mg2+/Mn2+ dependent 1D [Aphelenchoides besseyi]|nr:Protein phosphatase, Mg2+/Mn2+ dependent 1D [Aphelenchoides besseyi]